VLLDAGDPWAGGRLPPLGRLREPLTALRRATAVLVTKLPAEHETLLEEITARLQRIAGELPVLAARLEPSRLRTAEGWQEPAALAGRRIFAFAGIGRPQGFVDLLEGAGAELVGRRWFPDHHRYASAQLDALRAAALEREAVAVTTAKDAVKLPEDSSVWVVEAEMSPLEGSWNSLWALLPEAIW
jgi:tetraacyldisaccharide 4'-kinase